MKTIYSDVDNTLLFSAAEHPQLAASLLPRVEIAGRAFYVNMKLLNMLIDCQARGIRVVVWTAGGEQWAQVVLNKLEEVNLLGSHSREKMIAVGKPDWLFDDKQPEDFLPKVEYLHPLDSEHHVVSTSEIMRAFRKAVWGSYNLDMKDLEEELKMAGLGRKSTRN